MESFMDAPVGVLAEEAGDAELLLPPHHTPSIPARPAIGNCTETICGIGNPACAVLTGHTAKIHRAKSARWGGGGCAT
jgi:hypothetical protein